MTKVDVRILSATRRDLDAEVLAGRFREDLYYRLAVARVELPALRHRDGDVGLLTRHFWRKLDVHDVPIPGDLVARFEGYAWPGNVRELRNAICGRIALGELAPPPGLRAPRIGAPDAGPAQPSLERDFAQRILEAELPLISARQRLIDEFERRYVARVLIKHGGNITRAAHASGIARRYFYAVKARVGA